MLAAKMKWVVVAGLMAVAVGCGGKGSAGTTSAAAASAADQEMVIRRGQAPLTAVVAAGGKVEVVDVTEGQTLLKTTVPLNSVVTLNWQSGVTINARPTQVKGPLAKGHEYELRYSR